MLVVTSDEIHGWELQRVCGEVYGVSVRVGNDPSNPADSRAAAVARMLEHVRIKGGNAAVGLRLDSCALGDGRVEICAYATAVVAAPVDDGARQTATALGYGQPASSDGDDTAQEPSAAEPEPQQPAYDPAQQYAQPQGQPWSQDPSGQSPYAQPQYGQQPYPQQPGQPGQPGQYGQQPYPQQPYPGQYGQQPYPQNPQQNPQQYPPGYPGPQ